jgi:hypothetical protein
VRFFSSFRIRIMLTVLRDPEKLCEFLLETCQERGVELHVSARPVGIAKDENGRLAGLKVNRENGKEDLSTLSSLAEIIEHL